MRRRTTPWPSAHNAENDANGMEFIEITIAITSAISARHRMRRGLPPLVTKGKCCALALPNAALACAIYFERALLIYACSLLIMMTTSATSATHLSTTAKTMRQNSFYYLQLLHATCYMLYMLHAT